MKKRYTILIGLLLLFNISYATIINPPSDLGDMLHQSEIVVFGTVLNHIDEQGHFNEFRVLQSVKGHFQIGDQFVLEEYSKFVEEGYIKVAGDIDFEVGKDYLLFLGQAGSGNYKLSFLALSSFEVGMLNGKQIAAHNAAFRELILLDTESLNLNGLKGAYELPLLLSHLEEVATQYTPFNETQAGLQITGTQIPSRTYNSNKGVIDLSKALCEDGIPCHCTTFYGGDTSTPAAGNPEQNDCTLTTPGKFVDNTWEVCVFGVDRDMDGNLNGMLDLGGDPSTTTELEDLQNAITAINAMPGINMTYEGIDAVCSTTCSPNGAASTAQACNNTLNDPNKLWVFFDDLCDELVGAGIEPGCAGVVGLGSSFFTGICHQDDVCGNTWVTLQIPFLIMNENAGCVGRYDYTRTMIHELLSAIGLGNIGGTFNFENTEIMGTGCAAIDGTTVDDTQCTAIMNYRLCAANAPTDPDAIPGDMGFDGDLKYGITELDNECTDWLYNPTSKSACNISNVMITNVNCDADSTLTFDITFDYENMDEDMDGMVAYEVSVPGEANPTLILPITNTTINSGDVNTGNVTLTITETFSIVGGIVTVRNADVFACSGTDALTTIPECLDCSFVDKIPTFTVDPVCAGTNPVIKIDDCNYAFNFSDPNANIQGCIDQNSTWTGTYTTTIWYFYNGIPGVDPMVNLIGLEPNINTQCEDVPILASLFPNTTCDPINYTIYAEAARVTFCASFVITNGILVVLETGDFISRDESSCNFLVPIEFTVNPVPDTAPTVSNDGSCNYNIMTNCMTETAMAMLPSSPSPAGTADVLVTNSQGGCATTFTGISYDACVPVELVSFQGEQINGKNHLTWVTASEQDNSHFLVERSEDGVKFEAIGKVQGSGTTLVEQGYEFIDEAPLVKTTYYRLKQVDLGGTFEYSNIIAISTDKSDLGLSVYPSPTASHLQVVANEEIQSIRIIDFVGRTLQTFHYEDMKNIELDVSDLTIGTYFLSVQANDKVQIQRFVKH